MKIALLGYGKMGQIIEKLAQERNHEIVLIVDHHNQHDLTIENLQKADVAIEFSRPDAVLNNIQACFNANLPIVVGTTGWYGQLQHIKNECESAGQSLLYGSNFSIGVNIFFHVNEILAKLMNNYPYYEVQVEEIHHTQKLDAPSGTAMTIAEGIIENLNRKEEWKNILTEEQNSLPGEELKNSELFIKSLRIENVPGTHTVVYGSDVDTIEFKHTAHNRGGFALGAIVAAEWLKDKKGFFSVKDMFDFSA